MTTFHVDNNGDVKRCVAQTLGCPYGGSEVHGVSPAEARAKFEALNAEATIPFAKRRSASPKLPEFTAESYYGEVPPRPIQLEALNAVARELEDADATQLVAACGTGKSYMGRQLLQHEMMKPNANGISVILTSSIKLAADTAADLRPDDGSDGGYDKIMGTYGDDYAVIEVHSGVPQRANGLESVRDIKGAIQADRIRDQLEEAIRSGKRVVIVSTYDSCGKVQEAQEMLADERYEADIIMHDEAHNILGQQKPTTVASEDNELTAYTGFANEIPGAIQAKKRLYATASPVLREAPGDADEPETIDEAIEVAKRMKAGDQHARLTYYSDNTLVGKVSGFISQEEAIASGCLAKPEYAVRESRLRGALKDFNDPVVAPDGKLMEREESQARNPLSVRTYGAIAATLDALVADPEGGKNPATNVLAYVGSISQAEAFKEHFRAVANAEAQGMSPFEALKLKDSSDAEIRRRARMALLAARADVKAAHSSTDGESVREKRAAFEMFKGRGVQDAGWDPERRVLANVDIFSEGVSISEIDAVVLSDDEKTSERAMTQAIGRSIRVIPGNAYKTTGHVIVPSVTDESGVHATEASVHLAAYGASRVERALVAKKLRGEGVRPDETTEFTIYGADGAKATKKARSFAQEAGAEILPLAAAAEAHAAHTYLVREVPEYRTMTPNQQASMVKSRIAEKAASPRTGEADRGRLNQISDYVKGKSAHELREERRNARVVTSALAVGDVSSLSPTLSRRLIEAGVLSTSDSVAKVTAEEKLAHVQKHAAAIRYALVTKPVTTEHERLRAAIPTDVLSTKSLLKDSINLLTKGATTSATEVFGESFDKLLANQEFVNAVYDFSQEKDPKRLKLIDSPFWKSVRDDFDAQERARQDRQHEEASRGEQSYQVNPAAVRKTGELKSAVLRKLLDSEEFIA